MSTECFRSFPSSDGTCWELPRRELGEFGKFGWALVAICGFGSVFLLIWSVTWLVVGIGILVEGKIWGLFVAVFSLIGIWGLVYLLRFGMLGWYLAKSKTSCQVEVGSKYLFSNEPLGLFTWRRKCETANIKQLKIERSGSDKYSGEELDLDFDAELMTIRATTDRKSFLVAPGYRYAVLAPLLSELGTALNRNRSKGTRIAISSEVGEPSKAELSEEDVLPRQHFEDHPLGETALVQQPADSNIEIHDSGDDKAYQVLPMGIRKGSKGMLGFSIVWNLIMLIFTVVIVVIYQMGELPDELNALAATLLAMFFFVFWLVGILSVVSTVNSGRRTAMLGIADGQLFVERKSIFGINWIELPVARVKKINVGPSGTEINNIPVLELQIRDTDGHKHRLLSQLPNDDLYWLAQELRKSLESATQS